MSLAETLKTELKKGRKPGRFRDQLERYRRFKADMARHGVVLSEDSYDIPLNSRLRRNAKAKTGQ